MTASVPRSRGGSGTCQSDGWTHDGITSKSIRCVSNATSRTSPRKPRYSTTSSRTAATPCCSGSQRTGRVYANRATTGKRGKVGRGVELLPIFRPPYRDAHSRIFWRKIEFFKMSRKLKFRPTPETTGPSPGRRHVSQGPARSAASGNRHQRRTDRGASGRGYGVLAERRRCGGEGNYTTTYTRCWMACLTASDTPAFTMLCEMWSLYQQR